MAWTLTKTKTVFGDKKVVIIDVTTDSAEATVETGLKRIDGFTMGIQSLTALATMLPNVGSTATALNGYIGASGFTSGDEMFLTVYGT